MRITWSEPAVANLKAIHDFISRDAPGRADSFVQRLIAAAEVLRDHPHMGRVVPEGDGRHRELFFDPYRIIYRVQASEIYLVSLVHGARDLAALWERLGLGEPPSKTSAPPLSCPAGALKKRGESPPPSSSAARRRAPSTAKATWT